MNESIQRQIRLTIIATLLLVAVFLVGLYLPSRMARAKIRHQIRTGEQTIDEVPAKLAQLEAMTNELRQAGAYLARVTPYIPIDPDPHLVVQQVARLADDSGLTDAKWESLPVIPHESYEKKPYRLSFAGSFWNIVQFLHGLENFDRLFVIERISLNQSGRPARLLRADIKFSVYSRYRDELDSEDYSGSRDVNLPIKERKAELSNRRRDHQDEDAVPHGKKA